MSTQWTPRKLNSLELSEFEKIVEEMRTDGAQKEAVWNLWHGYFLEHPLERDIYYFTFFRWYTDVTWEYMQTLSPKEVIYCYSTMVPMGISLGHDPLQEMFFYMESQVPTYDFSKTLFQSIANVMRESSSFCGLYKNTPVLFSEVVKKLEVLWKKDADSMERSEVFQWVYMVIDHMVPEEMPIVGFPSPTTENITNQLLELVYVLTQTSVEGVPELIEQFHFDQYATSEKIPVNTRYTLQAIEQYTDVAAEIPVSDVPDTKIKNSKREKYAFQDVVSGIHNQFGADFSTIDIPKLLSYLDTQATEQGDERIRDLVRFNESTGQFEWNTDMLSE